jgi:kelch-like protein 10
METLTFLLDRQIGTKKDREIPVPKIARPRILREDLYVIGGWSDRKAANFIETYDTRAGRWIKVSYRQFY